LRRAGHRCDPIGAAARASQNVVDAFDPAAVAQHRLEDRQLGAAKALAGAGGGADRAVVFDQQQAVVVLAHLGHIALGPAQAGQPAQPRAQVGQAAHGGSIGVQTVAFAPGDQPVQAVRAELGGDGA